MIDPNILASAEAVLAACRSRHWKLATAESCTGGLIAGALTAIAGSSDVVDRGFVTYSNEAKVAMLGVDTAVISAVGAVSEQVARAMAEGAIRNSLADIAVAVTGVAGPGGGTDAKPVGLVWFGLASKTSVHSEYRIFPGDRAAVREATVVHALKLIGQSVGG